MRQLLVIIFTLYSSTLLAKPWAYLETNENYLLTQDLQLKTVERSGSFIDIPKGEIMKLKEFTPLPVPGYPMFLYTFELKSCPGPDMRTEMIIVPVERTGGAAKIGVELEGNCELKFYFESKDYYRESLFE